MSFLDHCPLFLGPSIDLRDPAIALSIILGRVGNANHVPGLGRHYGDSECNALGRQMIARVHRSSWRLIRGKRVNMRVCFRHLLESATEQLLGPLKLLEKSSSVI